MPLDILIVDDEPDLRMELAYLLTDFGHVVAEAADGAEALHLCSERVFDLVLCDIRLPKIDGMALLRRLRQQSPSTAVVIMTAFPRVPDALAAVRAGAFDYVTKPFDSDEFPGRIIERIAERRKMEWNLGDARQLLADGAAASPIVGRSPPMMRLAERIDTIAQSEAPVLITGESGTGKELIARTLHQRSRRARKSFVTVNCAALPETLLEAELFGHERGAFTGAVHKRDGRFKIADGGTMLLDEVAEMSMPAQSKLLRVLQDGVIEPLGSSTPVRVDVRILSATHAPLKERIAEGRFREDLYYRLNVLDLRVPPLRDRASDLPLLLQHFLREFTPTGREPPAITPRAWRVLSNYDFPGNVREFAHAVERAVVLSRGREIDVDHLPSDIAGSGPHAAAPATLQPLSVALKEFEADHLRRALLLCDGVRTRAAELLGISRKNLWEKLRAHGIETPDELSGPIQLVEPIAPHDDD
jgi:two-component system response regulator HydG/two-component system response regulator AtoC